MFFKKYFIKYPGNLLKYQQNFIYFCPISLAWMKVNKIQQIFNDFSKSFYQNFEFLFQTFTELNQNLTLVWLNFVNLRFYFLYPS